MKRRNPAFVTVVRASPPDADFHAVLESLEAEFLELAQGFLFEHDPTHEYATFLPCSVQQHMQTAVRKLVSIVFRDPGNL